MGATLGASRGCAYIMAQQSPFLEKQLYEVQEIYANTVFNSKWINCDAFTLQKN